MNGGPSGFNNAPVTRGFVVASALFTIFLGVRGRTNNNFPALSYQGIFGKLKLWKFVASIFAFSSTPELIFGLYVLYYFRVFERQIGSNKYSVFVLFSVLVSFGLEILVLAFLKDRFINSLSSGPYSCFFILEEVYATWIMWHSCWIAVSYEFPMYAEDEGTSSPVPPRNGPITAPAATRRHPLEGNYPSSMAPLLEPPEDSISTLVSMGFNRNHARQALVQARNDINAATNILLEAQSH